MLMNNLKCLKCNIQKCKAECCTWVPLRLQFLKENERFIQRPIYQLDGIDFDGYMVRCVTHIEEITPELRQKLIQEGMYVKNQTYYVDLKKQICPFLKDDYSCAVYQRRPEICKAFGSTTEPDNPLTCHYHIGRNYHFPDKNTPEYKQINNFKYFKRDYLSNKKLMEEFFPEGISDNIKQIISKFK